MKVPAKVKLKVNLEKPRKVAVQLLQLRVSCADIRRKAVQFDSLPY